MKNSISLIFTLLSAAPVWAKLAEVYTTEQLDVPGLTGSYVNQYLGELSEADDWRVSQKISGTRVDPAIHFGADTWGDRSAIGITGGKDTAWENFSVQWNGWLKVGEDGQRFTLVSNHGSRMWIDSNKDGSFEEGELLDNGWGREHALSSGERSGPLQRGVYQICIQYSATAHPNEIHLVCPDWVPRQFIPGPQNPRQIVKTLVINYEPRVPGRENKRLWEALGWQDPRRLTQQFKADLEYATGGAIEVQIVGERHLDAFPVFTDGFRYNPDEYVKNWESGKGWHEGAVTDFYFLARMHGLEELVNSGAIDEILLFGGPYFETLGETWMAGPNAFYINGPILPEIGFDRAIVGYGLNYERGVAEMVHNLGHRTEDHGQRAFGPWNLKQPVTAFDHYTANYRDSPGQIAGLGSCHVPANGESDYDYGNRRVVPSTAWNWPDYPDIRNESKPVSRESWALGPAPDYQRDYLSFYFGLMPRKAGTDGNGRQANWFKYIWDFNSYEQGSGLPRRAAAFASGPTIVERKVGEQLLTVRYYDPEGIDPASLGDQNIEVRTPRGGLLPVALVAAGPPQVTTAGFAQTVRYRAETQEGSWGPADAGTYTVSMRKGQVRSKSGEEVAAGDIGHFKVDIPDASVLPVAAMLASGKAKAVHTEIDIGPLAHLFDGSTSTLIRTKSINPAVVTLDLQSPRELSKFRVWCGHHSEWSVESAASLEDLERRERSWSTLVPPRKTIGDSYSEATLAQPATARYVRLSVKRLEGDDYVHIQEWQLVGPETRDTTPPRATEFRSPEVHEAGGTSQFIDIVWTDDVAMDPRFLDSANLRVIGPQGFSVPAVFYDVDRHFPDRSLKATYWFVPPGGSWDAADNGTYHIRLQDNKVRDRSGNAAKPGELGSISVDIPK